VTHEAIKTLAAFGLPDGAARPAPITFDDAAVRQAIVTLLGEELEARERELLTAWLRGFRHHWPRRFAEALGSDGDDALAKWDRAIDPNRYLKLRRIAVENLARAI
jgi:hypothetical protein